MLDWFAITCGGAALYAAGKWLHARINVRRLQKTQRSGRFGQPLKLVVAQCEAKWFLQDLKLAMEGDCEAMVRVSHMLMSGYGTKQDHTAAAQWMRQAWAIQNYREPAQLHDMLDVRDSDIPALNDARPRQSVQAVQAAQMRRQQGSSSSPNSTPGAAAAGGTGPSAASVGGDNAAGGGNALASARSSYDTSSSSTAHLKQCAAAALGGRITPAVLPAPADQPLLRSAQQQQQQQQRSSQRCQQQQHKLHGLGRFCKKLVQQQQQQKLAAAVTGQVCQQQHWPSAAASAIT